MHLQDFSLRFVELNHANIGDAGVKSLCRLRNLEVLSLIGTDVTDESVPRLMRLKKLKVLSISRTKITEAGAAELKRALPGAIIHHRSKFAYASE